MGQYNEYDVVVTNENETSFYWEIADNEKDIITGLATKDEAEYYAKEYAYWEQEKSDNIASSYYCYPAIPQ